MTSTARSRTVGQTAGANRRGLHWLTIVATGVVAFALLLASADGYHNHLVGNGDYFGEPPLINWVHGWPLFFAVRRSVYPLSGVYVPGGGGFTGDHGAYSRWPIDDAPVSHFYAAPLILDIAVFAVLLCGTAMAVQRLTMRWGIANRFGLKGVFALMTLIAVGLAMGPSTLLSQSMRYPLHVVVGSVLALATAATLFTLARVAVSVIQRARHARHGVQPGLSAGQRETP